jgi:Ca2+-binding RTX toxin-like protein
MRRALSLVAMMAVSLLLASGVALAVTKIGTDGPDTLRGTNGADTLVGKGGSDTLIGLRGTDTLLGGTGKDSMWGGYRDSTGRGEDTLVGGSGNDAIFGSQGSNNIVGQEGNDFLLDGNEPNPKKDTISAGPGNDVVFAWNSPAGMDLVACGSGYDRVAADRLDKVARDCEKVSIYHRSTFPGVFFESIPESFWAGLP